METVNTHTHTDTHTDMDTHNWSRSLTLVQLAMKNAKLMLVPGLLSLILIVAIGDNMTNIKKEFSKH